MMLSVQLIRGGVFKEAALVDGVRCIFILSGGRETLRSFTREGVGGLKNTRIKSPAFKGTRVV